MNGAYELYGFSSYDPDVADTRHLLLCDGCRVCLRDNGGPYTRSYDDIYNPDGSRRLR